MIFFFKSKALIGGLLPNIVNKFFFTFQGCKNLEYKGDGLCDDGNNNKGCEFDGGDCCLPIVNQQFCTKCTCLSPLPGREGSLGMWPKLKPILA